jgi:colanic acid/amylovoran biosynthesis glycosyltransferase
LFRLARVLVGALFRSPQDALLLLWKNVNSPLREQIVLHNRLLPFAGQHFDIIYFPWNSAAIEYLPLFDTGRPVLVSCRGSQIHIAPHDPKRAWFQNGLRETLSRAAAVHCVSESIQREAVSYGLELTKSHVIRPAVDAEYFQPAERTDPDESVLRIVAVGSLIWVKGYEYALQAISILKTQRIAVSLDILGEGPDRQRLLYTIHDLDLGTEVNLCGNLPHEDLRKRLNRGHVFLLSSVSEGISNAALEAMACALPIVTTDCGGMREAVTNGVEGFVVQMRSATDIAMAISTLWKDPNLRRRMGEAARSRVVSSFTLDSQVARFATLCRSLVTG